ncbi:MAG: UDP-N-acetylmuramate dehydrogenase [Deferrisomatales bacterium]
MAKTALDLLQERVRGRTVLNAPMDRLTTMGVGGPADVLVAPADRGDLAEALRFLAEQRIPYLVLGKGSNLIVRDAGIRGAVITLEDGFRAVERRDPTPQGPTVRAEAGVAVRRFVRWTVDQGIAGFEPLVGLPATLGGALAMNAGAWGFELGQRVIEVEVMDPQGEVHVFPRDMLRFAYRGLELPEGSVILAARLQGEAGEPALVKARAQELFQRRRDTQPTQEASSGCIFKNPPGKSAGQLIDACGLKGVRNGGAEVSRIHANFIVNTGGATARQVVALIGMVQERVYVRHRIKLEPEVRIVGEWERGKLRIQE